MKIKLLAFLFIIAIVLMCGSASAELLQYDTFDNYSLGDLSDNSGWTDFGTVTLQDTVAYNNTAVQLHDDSAASLEQASLSVGAITDSNFSTWFYITNTSSCDIKYTNSGSTVGRLWFIDGYFYCGLGVVNSTVETPIGEWFQIKADAQTSESDFSYYYRTNESDAWTIILEDQTASALAIDTVTIETSNAGIVDLYFDDFAIYTGEYPGLPYEPVPIVETVYHVSTSGNDSNNGSFESPWLTVDYALSTVTAGETVYVQPGTYYEAAVLDNSGTAENPITIIANGTVIMDGSGTEATAFYGVGQEYFTITGFTIQNYTTNGIYFTGSYLNGAVITNNTIQYIGAESSYGMGIWIRATSSAEGWENVLIENNTIKEIDTTASNFAAINPNYAHNSTYSNNSIYGEEIRYGISYQGINNIIEYNTISGVSPYNAGKGITSGNADYSIIRYNNVSNTDRGIRYDYNVTGVQIYNNIVSDCVSNGIQIYNGCDYFSIHDNELINSSVSLAGADNNAFINNTVRDYSSTGHSPGGVLSVLAVTSFYDPCENLTIRGNFFINGTYGQFGTGGIYNLSIIENLFSGFTSAIYATIEFENNSYNANNVNITNNVFTNITDNAISVYDLDSDNFIMYNNIYYGVAGSSIDATMTNITADYNCIYDSGNYSGISQGAHDIYGDPLFVSGVDFHLQNSSLCIDAGYGGVDIGLYPYATTEAIFQIVTSSPSGDTISVYNTSTLTTSITVNKEANISVYLDSVLMQTNTSVTTASYTDSSLDIGTFEILMSAYDGSTYANRTWTVTVSEYIAPSEEETTLNSSLKVILIGFFVFIPSIMILSSIYDNIINGKKAVDENIIKYIMIGSLTIMLLVAIAEVIL